MLVTEALSKVLNASTAVSDTWSTVTVTLYIPGSSWGVIQVSMVPFITVTFSHVAASIDTLTSGLSPEAVEGPKLFPFMVSKVPPNRVPAVGKSLVISGGGG